MTLPKNGQDNHDKIGNEAVAESDKRTHAFADPPALS